VAVLNFGRGDLIIILILTAKGEDHLFAHNTRMKTDSQMVTIGDNDLTIDDFYSVLYGTSQVQLSGKALEKIDQSHEFLVDFSHGKLIYGINTGFGPMAQYKIPDKDLIQLQYNLIRSHSTGSGRLLETTDIRSLMIARLSSLMRGHSGVNRELVLLLRDLINKEIHPCIFEHGGVGASGDLVQLAHLALTLIGEGEVIYKGQVVPAAEAYASENLVPLTIHKREGIAVLNGTSAMSGIGAINLIHSRNLINWAVMFSAMINEMVEAFDDHFSAELNIVKHHPGQQRIAAAMRTIVKDSSLVRKRTDHLYHDKDIREDVALKEKVQEYYSLRCVPQILGAILDTIEYAETVVMSEINSVNDNPVIDLETRNVYHGGNFHGDYVSLEMDKLKIAVTKLSMLAERQLNFLLNDKLNHILPPFINLGKLGLNYGSQGMQFTATSTVAENQTLSMPTYIHSIPNNNDNQDIVSMGANAALIARRVIDNSFEVLAIHGIAIIQAFDYLQNKDKLSATSLGIYNELRTICPKFVEDLPLYKQIRDVTQYLKKKKISHL
jgi:histidine ammonia-lyase